MLVLDIVEKQSWGAALKIKLNGFGIYQMSDTQQRLLEMSNNKPMKNH